MKQLLAIFTLFAMFEAFPVCAQMETSPLHFRNPTKRLAGESITYRLVPNPQPTAGDSSVYLYNNASVVVEQRHLELISDQWVLRARTLYVAYDSLGQSTVQVIQYTSDQGGSWANQYRITTSYDANGDQSSSQLEHWNTSTNEWQLGSSNSHDIYDDHGHLIYTNDGFLATRWDYTYDSLGYPVWIVSAFKYNTDPAWQYTRLQHFVYDPQYPGRYVYTTHSVYNAWASSWSLLDSTTYRYDLAGNLTIQDVFELYNPTYSDEWGCPLAYRALESYNAQNLPVQLRFLAFCQDDTLKSTLLSTTDYFYTYDTDGDPLHFSTVSTEQDSSVRTSFHRFTYETVSRVEQASHSMSFLAYPNPATSSVLIKSAATSLILARVFDLNGRLLLTQALQGDENAFLTLNTLREGSYLLQVVADNGETATQTLVVLAR